MSFVWLRVQAALRHRWRALVVLAVVVGIGGGAAITALAGAQRTDTAVPQFVSYSLPDTGGFLFGSVLSPPVTPGIPADSLALAPAEQRVVHLPQVVSYFRAPYLFFAQSPAGNDPSQVNVIGDADSDLYRTVDRPIVVAGRLPRPDQPFEVAVNEFAAQGRHLHVGSTVRLYAFSYPQIAGGQLTESTGTPVRPAGPSYKVHVTAIVRFPQDVNAALPLIDRQGVAYESQRNLYTTPAFLQRLAQGLGVPVQQVPDINLLGVRLRHGAADWDAFAKAVPRVSGGKSLFAAAGNVYDINRAAASAQRGIRLDVVALLIFGLLVALITLLFVGQSIGRQVRNQAGDFAVLRSLGADRRQLVSAELAVSGFVGVVGGVLAVAVAIAASPLMPVGLARQAEITPGVNANPVFLVPGFFILAALITLAALVPALRASRRASAGVDAAVVPRNGARAGWLSRGLSPVPAIGVRFGLEPGRGLAGTTAGGVASAIVAIATVAAALTFGASLNGLLANPRAQGWNWDVLVGNPNDQSEHEQATAKQLARDPDVSGYAAIALIAGANQGTATIDGHLVPFAIALDPLKGSVHPTLVAGHPPRAANEIVLASKTLQDLHRRLGQSVQIPTPTGVQTLRIVGEMISPSVGDLLTNGMGEGAWISGTAIHRQLGAQTGPQATAQGLPEAVFDLFLVRYAHGVTPAAGLASLQRQFGHDVLMHVPPEDVINLQSVDQLPYLLTALVVVLGVATVGNALVVSVRRRRRDLAILKTVGFVRRQVAGVVAWQASSIGVVALLIGLPVGVAAGRWAWDAVANGLGSSAPTIVPALALVAVVPCVLVVANLIAAAPGWSAARVPPVTAMRAE
jgi:predicted lysophospholipase L1 biosynthesis ABC-type transport system permease subunit